MGCRSRPVPRAGRALSRRGRAPLDRPPPGSARRRRPATGIGRPLLIGGALTSAALSIAGAAYVAWRLNRPPASAMVRAARAVARTRAGLMPLKLPSFRARRDTYPADLWTKCPTCETMLFNKQLDKAMRVCPNCGHHFRLSAADRLELLLDPGTWQERDAGLQSVDALGFVDQKPYPERLAAAQASTGMRDAAVWGTGAIGGQRSRSASWTSGSWAARWVRSSARR